MSDQGVTNLLAGNKSPIHWYQEHEKCSGS